jgi:hypothetical protein
VTFLSGELHDYTLVFLMIVITADFLGDDYGCIGIPNFLLTEKLESNSTAAGKQDAIRISIRTTLLVHQRLFLVR